MYVLERTIRRPSNGYWNVGHDTYRITPTIVSQLTSIEAEHATVYVEQRTAGPVVAIDPRKPNIVVDTESCSLLKYCPTSPVLSIEILAIFPAVAAAGAVTVIPELDVIVVAT